MKEMNFNEFTKVIGEQIKNYLPEEYQTGEIVIKNYCGLNGKLLTGFKVKRPYPHIPAMIYLNDYYNKFKNGYDFDCLIQTIANDYKHAECSLFNVDFLSNFENCKEFIHPKLINARMNSKMLEIHPHVLIEDLAVVFYIEFSKSDDESRSITITNDILNLWNIDLNTLYNQSVENLSIHSLPVCKSMTEMFIEKIMDQSNLNYEMARDIFYAMFPEDLPMYVITNKSLQYGASSILDQEFMKKTLEKLGSNFYFIPSSIHELLLFPMTDITSVEEIENIIGEVNSTLVQDDELLSDHVYTYSLAHGLQSIFCMNTAVPDCFTDYTM